jgi:hypothetical protein
MKDEEVIADNKTSFTARDKRVIEVRIKFHSMLKGWLNWFLAFIQWCVFLRDS